MTNCSQNGKQSTAIFRQLVGTSGDIEIDIGSSWPSIWLIV